jgi:sodium transport system permease protein
VSIRNVRIIFLKEMLETLRDKRTLMVMVLGPVLIYPILILAFSQMATLQETRLRRHKTTVYLCEKMEWPEIREALANEPDLELVETDEPRPRREEDVVVQFDSREPKEGERDFPKITVAYRQTNVHSERGKERVVAALERYARRVTSETVDLTKDERYLYPLILEEENLSSRSEQVRTILAMSLPMILVLMTIAGAMYPAIDTTAGEKERGTIETILASPAGRDEIVYGKFLSVFVICVVTGLLNLAAMSLTFIHVLRASSASILPVASILLVLVSLLPLAVLFSALMMAVSTYARTFREAQNYVTPVYLLCLIPAMVSVQRGFDLNDFLCLVPVINMSLFFREVMEGVYSLRHILLVFVSTSVYAAVALRATVKLFHDENALFSLEKPFALFVRRRYLKARPFPSLGEAFFAAAVIFVFYYFVSSLFVDVSGDSSRVLLGTMLSQWLAMALPVILFARYLKLDVRRTFRLQGFRPLHILGMLLLFVGGFFILIELAFLQKDVFPVPEEFAREFSSGVEMGRFLPVVLALALTPAICEELLFRGFILSGMSRFSPAMRILLNGVLFGAYHVFLFKLLPTAFLGMVISFLAVYSGSIVPGMLFHFINNFSVLAIGRYSGESTEFFRELFNRLGLSGDVTRWLEQEAHVPWPAIAASAFVFLVGAALIWKSRFRVGTSRGGDSAGDTGGGPQSTAETAVREVENTEKDD